MLDKKICIFTSFYPPHLGGVERYVQCLANELKNSIYKVIVVTLNTEEQSELEIKENLYIYRLPVCSLFKNRYPLPKKNKCFWSLIKQIIKHNPDLFIINLRFYLLSLFASKLGFKNKIPVISIEHISGHLTVHNPLLDFLGHYYEHFVTKKAKKYVSSFYGVSKACNDWLKHFGIDAKGIIYNSVNINSYDNIETNFRKEFKIPNNATVFTCATRLLKEKGILLLIEAFKQINSLHQNTYLFILGDGSLYNNLSNDYKLRENNIFIIGKKDNKEVFELIMQSDVAVIPSFYPEGLPTLALEAGSLGKAVIATDVGGTKELIINNEYGLLIKPNSLNELIQAMNRLIEDKEYRIISGENLKKRIKENFTWKMRAEEIRKII